MEDTSIVLVLVDEQYGFGGTSNSSITNAYIYAPDGNQNAIGISGESTGTVNITSTWLGNGRTAGDDSRYVIANMGKANMTVKDSRIYAGQYSTGGISVYEVVTINLTGDTSIWARNTTGDLNYGPRCVGADSSLTSAEAPKVVFNSTGYFYSAGQYVGYGATSSMKYTVTMGNFVSRETKYMFHNGSGALTSYYSSGSTGNRSFYYMTSLNTRESVSISGCYYYSKGIS